MFDQVIMFILVLKTVYFEVLGLAFSEVDRRFEQSELQSNYSRMLSEIYKL